MFIQILAIARNTFIEAIRQPFYFVLTMITGLALVMTLWWSGFAMSYSSTSEMGGDNKVLLEIGLATVFVGGMILAAFTATAVLSREIENKTVLTVVSKPVPRPVVILGKYVGVASAILLAVGIMLVGFLLTVRHGVMSTAADVVDGPVATFGISAVLGAMALGVIANYLYGWYFSQTTMLAMFPLLLVAYGLTLVLDKHWAWQSPDHFFKPQLLIACAAQAMAVLVLSALATAVSTRLGQVMTIIVCVGVFIAGLLTNHFLGRHAFPNMAVAAIEHVDAPSFEDQAFENLGTRNTITIDRATQRSLRPGMSVYYGPNPNGFPLITPRFPAYTAPTLDERATFAADAPGRILITNVDDKKVTIQKVGAQAVRTSRPPQAGDFIFLEPPEVYWPALIAWAVVPNLHYFWLVDAVAQNHPVPVTHVILLSLYTLSQIAVFLALGTALFQKRDVG